MDEQKIFVPCLRGRNGPLHGVDFWIEKEEFVIGRHPESDLVLNNNIISAQHAKIVKRDNQYYLIDLNSTNGTLVNQERIDEKKLRTDDIVSFDKIEFQFIYRKDVSRTIISDPDETHPADINEIHSPPVQNVSIFHPKTHSPDNLQNRFMANIFALLVAFFIIGGTTCITNFILSPVKTYSILGPVLRVSFTELPLLLLPSYWFRFVTLDLAAIKFISVPIGFIISGIILQKFYQKSRYKNSIYFTYFFIFLSVFIQLAINNFNLIIIGKIYSNLGYWFSNKSITYIVHFFFMITMTLLPTYIGTFFIKRLTVEKILQKKL